MCLRRVALAENARRNMKSETVLEARNVSFSYKGKDVLQNVNIVLRNGSIVGLTGPNGIGKTTLLSLFIGDLIPGSGSVTINGKNPASISDRSKLFGVYLPGYGFTQTDKVGSVLSDLCTLFDADSSYVGSLLKRFGVDEFLNMRIDKLSEGMRKKFELVAASMTDVPVLILDEPTNGLDVQSVELLRKFVKEKKRQGVLVIISSHVMSELDLIADSLIGVCDGKARMLESFSPGVAGSAQSCYKSMFNE